MKNLKDKISNICGIVLVLSGSILSVATAGVALPAVAVTIATVAVSASGGILAYLTGKKPNGKPKSQSEVASANK